MVAPAIESERDLFVLEKIAAESFTLLTHPCQRQSGGKVNICFPNASYIQLSGNCHQSQNVVVLVHRLICDEFLVTFPDAVKPAVILQNIAGEDRLCFIGDQSGWCDCTSGLDVAVPVVNANNFDAVPFSHSLCTSMCLFAFIKMPPFQ